MFITLNCVQVRWLLSSKWLFIKEAALGFAWAEEQLCHHVLSPLPCYLWNQEAPSKTPSVFRNFILPPAKLGKKPPTSQPNPQNINNHQKKKQPKKRQPTSALYGKTNPTPILRALVAPSGFDDLLGGALEGLRVAIPRAARRYLPGERRQKYILHFLSD